MTDDVATELSWRLPSRSESSARRRIIQRSLLTAVAFSIAMFVALPSAWWGVGLLVATAAGGLMAYWQAFSFGRHFAQLPPNMHLSQAGFRWGSEDQPSGEIPRAQITSFRLDPSEPPAATSLIFLLTNDFESQPIALTPPINEEVVRAWLQYHWSLEEEMSPRSVASPQRTLRLAVYLESHAEHSAWHWEGNRAGLLSLAAALRAAAAELPVPPAGAKPKLLEVIGTRREGSELLIGVDRQLWFDDQTLAAPAEQLIQLASDFEAGLEAVKSSENADFPLELAFSASQRGTIHIHLRVE